MGDPGLVGTERGSGDTEASHRAREGLDDARSPAHDVAGVVDLVEDDEGAHVGRPGCVEGWFLGDLGVGDDAAVAVGRKRLSIRGVAQVKAESAGRTYPLGAQMVGRADDDDTVDDVVLPQVSRDGQGERRLAGARGSAHQPVTWAGSQVRIQRLPLPCAQPHRHARPFGREP